MISMIRPIYVHEEISIPCGAESAFMSTNEIRTLHSYLNNNHVQYIRPKIFHLP